MAVATACPLPVVAKLALAEIHCPNPESPKDGKFTVRDRDSMQQERMTYEEFLVKMYAALEF